MINEPFDESPAKGEVARADGYVIHTSQEIDVLGRAAASGKSFQNYQTSEQGGTVTYSLETLTHRVQLALTDEEQRVGMDVSYLESLVRAQDSDAFIAQLYIMSALAPPAPLAPRTAATGWLDFDDVIEKVGWSPRSTAERREMHARIWEFIRFGERAIVMGERTIPYVDKKTGEKIDTKVHGAAWRVLTFRAPEQGTLGFAAATPVAAEIVMSPSLTALLTSPLTAQYLPMGETLGAIPGNKASGAWARVIGLALASFWRRHPVKSLNGDYKPTRRELLTHFPPKIAAPLELLESHHCGRAFDYWCDALKFLVDRGILAQHGETQRPAAELRSSFPLRDWQRQWLDERVDLLPGDDMRAHIEGRIKSLSELKKLPAKLPRKTTRRKK